MRTLTQVWVFFVSLTFLFLFLGFQLAGRVGLFVAFLISLLFVYATLHRSLILFKKKLNAQDFNGNDPSGFLKLIQMHKLGFGFKKIYASTTSHPTPPLIWKSHKDEGHLILNTQLLKNLNDHEVRLLAYLMLSHMQNRSFLVTPILSVIDRSMPGLDFVSGLLSFVFTSLFKTRQHVIKSDLIFKSTANVSNYDAGYFINRLHSFDFNQSEKNMGTEYFSVLSIKNNLFNQYGIPRLDHRLKKIMGFSI